MYKRILIGLAAMMFSVSAFGQLQVFQGNDPGAGPNDARPNSDDAYDDFMAALPNGPVVVEDFESYKNISNVCGATINNGVTVACNSNDWLWNGPSGPNANDQNEIVGYNTTQGGKKIHYLEPDANPADLTYEFAQPIQAAGMYITGAGTSGTRRIAIRFNDGTNQVVDVPLNQQGGVSFTGFTHPGKFIAAIELRVRSEGDYIGVDDITIVQTNDTAFFNVTKDFEPDSTGDIDVSITCNNGIPSYDEATVTGGDPVGHTFVITNLDGADVSCVVEELNPTSGYKTLYNGADTSVGCTWEPVLAGDYSCEITNIAQDVTFGMTKVWDLTGAGTGGDAVVREARLTIACDRRITGTDPVTDIDRNVAGDWVAKWDSLSTTPSASYEVSVRARNGEPTCTASEKVFDSAIEQSVEGECVDVEIAVGGSEDSCVITNTVFFEGIPTLSQYGLAIMALLMLGVGFVGFRRFI